MVQRRAQAAGITTEVCNHTFRGTGITAYLENGGTLEKARQMAAHASDGYIRFDPRDRKIWPEAESLRPISGMQLRVRKSAKAACAADAVGGACRRRS